jgi:hypothetical protein
MINFTFAQHNIVILLIGFTDFNLSQTVMTTFWVVPNVMVDWFNTPASYLGDPGFESWPGDWLS